MVADRLQLNFEKVRWKDKKTTNEESIRLFLFSPACSRNAAAYRL